MRLTGLSFDDWIEHAFGHEVRIGRNPWFFDDDCDWWDPQPAEAVAFITRLFGDPEKPLAWFSDEQIAHGLTYLFSISASGHRDWIYSPDVAAEARLQCVRNIETLFARLFAPRCEADLAHCRRTPGKPLNSVCYMWWDEFIAIAHPDDRHFAALHDAALDVMDATLRMDSMACQEAALHGLGHWRSQFPGRVPSIIDAFIAANPGAEPKLLAYAHSARCGCVL